MFVMFSIEKRMRRGKSSKYFLGDKFGPVAISGLALVGFRADPICEHSNIWAGQCDSQDRNYSQYLDVLLLYIINDS